MTLTSSTSQTYQTDRRELARLDEPAPVIDGKPEPGGQEAPEANADELGSSGKAVTKLVSPEYQGLP